MQTILSAIIMIIIMVIWVIEPPTGDVGMFSYLQKSTTIVNIPRKMFKLGIH